MEWEDYFNKYKNKILNTAIIVFALIIANNIYQVQNKTFISLKDNKEREAKKNLILDEINRSDKRLKSYKSYLNKKDISSVIDTIGDIAKDLNIKIISLRPDPGQQYPLYVKYVFNLTANVKDYVSLGRFIGKLENSQDIYMIENLAVNPRYESSEESRILGLTVNLKISTFLFKD